MMRCSQVKNARSFLQATRRLALPVGVALTSFALTNLVMQAMSCRNRTFKLALPGYEYSFPRDHFAHKEFHTEWWYHVGHLATENGDKFGYELTFFRRAIKNPLEYLVTWNKDIYFAHFAITDKVGKRFAYFQRINARPYSLAGADEHQLCITNGPWSMKGDVGKLRLKASVPDYGVNLQLAAVKPPVVHGQNGVSQKADGVGRSSHYVSMTRSQTKGTLTFDGKQYRVSGISWMDHEFGTNQLTEKQVGWDWFCVQLDNNMEVMIYQMRNEDGSIDPNSSGTIMDADGTTRHIRSDECSVKSLGSWKSPKTGGVYPMGWMIAIPGRDIELKILPVVEDQELAALNKKGISYWEGASDVEAKVSGQVVQGKSYAELIGYAEPVPKDM